jgi:hypothetical protein
LLSVAIQTHPKRVEMAVALQSRLASRLLRGHAHPAFVPV